MLAWCLGRCMETRPAGLVSDDSKELGSLHLPAISVSGTARGGSKVPKLSPLFWAIFEIEADFKPLAFNANGLAIQHRRREAKFLNRAQCRTVKGGVAN